MCQLLLPANSGPLTHASHIASSKTSGDGQHRYAVGFTLKKETVAKVVLFLSNPSCDYKTLHGEIGTRDMGILEKVQ